MLLKLYYLLVVGSDEARNFTKSDVTERDSVKCGLLLPAVSHRVKQSVKRAGHEPTEIQARCLLTLEQCQTLVFTKVAYCHTNPHRSSCTFTICREWEADVPEQPCFITPVTFDVPWYRIFVNRVTRLSTL